MSLTVISCLHRGDPLPHRLDHPRGLMAQNAGEETLGVVTGQLGRGKGLGQTTMYNILLFLPWVSEALEGKGCYG